MKKILLFFLLLAPLFSFATHERAGEITYRCLGGYTYAITITTYTKGTSSPADRCFLSINFGDDTVHYTVCRSNFENGDPQQDPWGANSCAGSPECSSHHMGEWSIKCGTSFTLQSLNVKKNVYSTTHTYPGPGTYVISMTDPNRNADIVNVPSNQTPFSIQDTVKINPFLACNNSIVFTNCPIAKACAGSCFITNPGAVDPDGDSLSYKLGKCFEDVGTPVQGYFVPAGVSLNPITGDFTWCNPAPPQATNISTEHPCDEYNFAIDVEEWRKIGTKYYLVGTVRRDFQLTVCNCDNHPPVIIGANDTCILENTNLTMTVTATDVIENDGINSFSASGGPFTTTPSASFTTNFNPPQTPVTGIFSWTPACNQVRNQPYLVTFQAVDDGAPDNVFLFDYKSILIHVIAPEPKNLTATPHCNSIDLSWDAEACNPANNGLFGYRVYRKILSSSLACDTLKHSYCETGVPSGWNYTLIGKTAYNVTSFTDAGNLTPGTVYAYRVVAYFSDGAQSYASDPACVKLVRDVPIITNVSVASTGTSGTMDIKWLKPLADTSNYDTTKIYNHGPYSFQLLRGVSNVTPTYTVTTITNPYFAELDTAYSDNPLNTLSSGYTYRVDFYDTIPANCPAQKASSVFLSCNPNDNQIQITWNEKVPWTNYEYDIFRFNPATTSWDSIATTTLQTFTDTGLANGSTYCYKVKSIGAYTDTTLPHPLINWSQELCCVPVDRTPPCPLTLAVDSSCENEENILHWNNPNLSCCDDALYYIIYHNEVEDGEFTVVDTVHDINVITFIHDSLSSIAGCYAVTAVDSFGNESAYSNLVCVDNCPAYELPNVFSPNGDGSNDFFTPLHPYKFVKDIDIRIYNRWGTEVFHTTDPEILWDGTSEQTKMACSDGVYYYICIVNDIRLKGIVPRALKGYITLVRHK